MKETTNARLYRFFDTVAIDFGSETLYLTESLARQLSEELARLSRDIRAVKFSESETGTVNLQGSAKDSAIDGR